MKKTPDEWLSEPQFKGIKVLDPDGWDRKNYASSWEEPITETEMNRRLSFSTCIVPVPRRLTAQMSRDEAIEVAARHIYEVKGDRLGMLYVGWDQESDEVKTEWLMDVAETIDAYEEAKAS